MTELIKSDGEIKKILECNDASKMSIYSIDRDLEVGDIVYGYLTNPFHAQKWLIDQYYPFKVVAAEKDTIHLLGQKVIGYQIGGPKFTYLNISGLDLNKFFVHFLFNGEAHRFDAHVPTMDDINIAKCKNLEIRGDCSYWVIFNGPGNYSYPFYIENGKIMCVDPEQRMDALQLNLVPFVSIDKSVFETDNFSAAVIYRDNLGIGPCGSGDKSCKFCETDFGCLAGLEDDNFELASKESFLHRLNNSDSPRAPKTVEEKNRMIKILKEYYNYDYK